MMEMTEYIVEAAAEGLMLSVENLMACEVSRGLRSQT